MSGENVLAELKAEPATAAVPIAILSADATPGTIRRLKTKGAVASVAEPLDLTELGNLLDSVTAAAHPPIGRLPVHADHATGGVLAAGERGGQRMRDT